MVTNNCISYYTYIYIYIMLDIRKFYIDTRFKAIDSKSDSEFFIELPRSLNVPDNCICYIDDIVIPVIWSTIDARNTKLYMYVKVLEIFRIR
jgi:hypothetical protein